MVCHSILHFGEGRHDRDTLGPLEKVQEIREHRLVGDLRVRVEDLTIRARSPAWQVSPGVWCRIGVPFWEVKVCGTW